MEPAPPIPPKPIQAASARQSLPDAAPAFPTLNIDVPADMLADIDAKLAAGAAGAAAKPFPSPAAHVVPPLDEPPVDSDDEARTLVAHDVPATRQSLANIGLPPPAAPPAPSTFRQDDPRTMLAQPRGSSIPDLSQPLGGLPGSALGAPTAQDKSTTLVSALPNDAAAASRAHSAPSTLTALKGTAKMDPVEIPIGSIGPSPTTKPSPVAIALDSTLAMDSSPTLGSAAVAQPKGQAAVSPGAHPHEPSGAGIAAAILPVAQEASTAAPVSAKAAPAAMAVWQPKRRRLTGPVAMMLGILIGALLFAIVFAALFLIKPS